MVLDTVLASCKLEQIRKMMIWQFAVIGGLPYFYGKTGVYVVIYRDKDKDTTQGNLAELLGSPDAPIWCKRPSLGPSVLRSSQLFVRVMKKMRAIWRMPQGVKEGLPWAKSGES